MRTSEHHCEPIFAHSQSAHDRAMDKLVNTEPKMEFDVDDPNTRGRTIDDDDDDDSNAAATHGPKGAPVRRAGSLCESPCVDSI